LVIPEGVIELSKNCLATDLAPDGSNIHYYNPVRRLVIPSTVSTLPGLYKNLFGDYADTYLSSIVIHPDNQIFDSRENCNAIIETATNKLL
jgi:hypothetical protein